MFNTRLKHTRGIRHWGSKHDLRRLAIALIYIESLRIDGGMSGLRAARDGCGISSQPYLHSEFYMFRDFWATRLLVHLHKG